jgi:hypothetical protein
MICFNKDYNMYVFEHQQLEIFFDWNCYKEFEETNLNTESSSVQENTNI